MFKHTLIIPLGVKHALLSSGGGSTLNEEVTCTYQQRPLLTISTSWLKT